MDVRPVTPITLDPLSEADAPDLFAFEVGNRAWFEKWVGPRPDSYWELTSLTRIIRDQVAEGEPMFLIKRDGAILGRLNITGVDGGVGLLGYRIGERHVGQGVASCAVALGLDRARALGLWALEACVLDDNPASRHILEKAGFRKISVTDLDGCQMMLLRCDLD
ncbi:GNAT family N-acetyltransferase [Aliiroseovarius sp. KMU-50]|uniref:GNAT family N-acetyltransferase n=1 Tax=Aliiroseovarius salicola TaxID=3009082 RepID=A0ABT4VYY4_9RHOB|nr:GNAT family N-acetyltransferase [Aliiroseovarius sp. KMU-50]MDA5093462.1 GNAT family N-acetyltransferase [Aliiroseovarius sp. KMU-50]